MYRCQLCGTVVPPRTPCHRKVVQAPRQYVPRPRANCVVRIEKGKRKKTWTTDPGGVGTSIVAEVVVCPACAVSSA